jgi:hypothetical protein
MSLIMTAKNKAATHAGVAFMGLTSSHKQHDRPDVSVKILSRKHADTELTKV